MKRYDIAIVGGGLNGLVTASYLGRAGRSVIVLEKGETVGGTFSDVAIAPGIKAPAAFDTIEGLHPDIVRELGLENHGLLTIEGSGTTVVTGADTCERFTPDHPELAELSGFVSRLSQALERVWTAPLPPAEPTGMGGVVDLMRLGWALRRLGKRDFPEALRFLPMGVKDVLDEYLSNEALKAAVAAQALRGAWMAPRAAGSAYGLVHHQPTWAGGVLGNPVFAQGGPGALARALERAAVAAGVTIQTGSAVRRVLVDNGRATGVGLDDREVAADRVLSAIDPKCTFKCLVGAPRMTPDFVERVEQIRARGSITIIRLLLDRLPSFPGGPDTARGRIQIGATVDDLERAFDAAKYGELPERPLLSCTIPSALDNTLTPNGQHVMHIQAQFTPHGVDWSTNRETFGDRVVAMLDNVAPGLKESILHRQVESPVDLERRFSLTGGCLHHADLALDQLLYMRPIPGWYGYKTPVERLYMCGPGTHPGGAGTGLSGRNAAKVVLADKG